MLTTALWAFSFPINRALLMVQQQMLPESSTWFLSALCIGHRFGSSALVMLVWCLPTLHRLTWLEVWQGLGLAVFATAGLIFQMDGLAYTDASTSAFLTQCYCLILPLWVALVDRRWPTPVVLASCVLVLVGVAVLSDLDWRRLHLGRGELETLIASVMFAGQIIWLQRGAFARNNVNHFTLVMFVLIALGSWSVAAVSRHGVGDWARAYSTAPTLLFLAVLALFSTLAGGLLMNHWQPKVTTVQAGLIYCAEPLFASLLALVLPAWCSRLAGIQYANEVVGLSLLLGGGLITLANVLVQLQPAPAQTTLGPLPAPNPPPSAPAAEPVAQPGSKRSCAGLGPLPPPDKRR